MMIGPPPLLISLLIRLTWAASNGQILSAGSLAHLILPPYAASASKSVVRVDVAVQVSVVSGTELRLISLTPVHPARHGNYCKTNVPADERCGSSTNALIRKSWSSSGSLNFLINMTPTSC
jgi:hypothetical protein